MAKVVKVQNNKVSDDTWVGQTVVAGAEYTLAATEYLLWAADTKVLTDISSGDLGVSDGTSYLSSASARIDWLKGNPTPPSDTDQVPLSRIKQTSIGWTYQGHSFEFTCGTVGGALYSKDWTGTDFGFVTPKFYELISAVETLIEGANATDQGYLTANCSRSTFLWEPGHDYDIMSGELRFYTAITTDVRLWITAVPDVPAYMGGSKQLDTGGRNLRYTPVGTPIVLDGRVVKHLAYSATYHTSKFAFTLRHPAGFATPMQVTCQFYKL